MHPFMIKSIQHYIKSSIGQLNSDIYMQYNSIVKLCFHKYIFYYIINEKQYTILYIQHASDLMFV